MPHRAAPLLLCLLASSGCGLRGPLYLPEDSARTQEAARPAPEKENPATPQPAPQSQKRDRSTGNPAPPAN